MNKAPAIIPPERIVESVSHAGMQGWFEVELIHKPTGLIKQKLRFKNLITDAGLEAIGTGGGSNTIGSAFGTSGYMGVGTGTATPTTSDTGLQAQVVRTNSKGSPEITPTAGFGPDNDYVFYRTTKVFLPGTGTGNLTEVGIFNSATTGTMLARQLFRDSLGTPITIAKTADDELRVTYEFRLYIMKTTNVSTFTIKGVERTCTTRGYDIDANGRWGDNSIFTNNLIINLGNTWNHTTGYEINSYSSSAMPILTAPQTGTATGPSSAGWAAYTGGTRYREQTQTYNPGLGNLTIGSTTWGSGTIWYAPYITTIEPAVVKTNTERFTFTGRMSWGRV